jgi:hypothetical protein
MTSSCADIRCVDQSNGNPTRAKRDSRLGSATLLRIHARAAKAAL